MRPWLEAGCALDALNALAEARDARTQSGLPVRFVAAGARERDYEMRVFETGFVPTRAGNLHDWFNALAWLAFPLTKARINAMHAAAIPQERGRRGRLRDLLTLFDEGGVIVECGDAELIELLRGFRWKALFWDRRDDVLASMRFLILGHAVLEKALEPWPGLTCRALVVAPGNDADAEAAAWLARLPADATPQHIAPVPVFGYPGWLLESETPEFYDDTRYFRAPRG